MDELRARVAPAARFRPPAWIMRARGLFKADRWLLIIGGALLLRAALAVVLLETDLIRHNGWYFPNDDQGQYYGYAHAFAQGSIAPVYVTLGYGTLLVPFAATTDFVLQAMPAVGILQLLLAAPAALLLYRAGSRLLDRKSAALGTALWLALPLLLGPVFVPSYLRPFDEGPDWLGLTINVDYASALLAIAVLAVTSGAVGDASARRGLLVGVLGGLAFLVKPSNVVILGSALVALAVWRRRRAAAAAVGAAVLVYVPQLVFNDRIYGSPATFGYGHDKTPYDPVSITYLPRVYGKLAVSNYAGPLILIGSALALWVTWRRFRDARWLVVAQVVGFSLLIGTVYFSIGPTLLRYLTAVFPALCLAVGAALVGRPAERATNVRAPRSATVALGAAALLGAVALAALVGRASRESDVPTVQSMAPVARVSGRRVELRWHEPSAPADLTYQLQRSRQRDSSYGSIQTITSNSAIDVPGPGVWWYRIAITPYYRRHAFTPASTVGLSPPVRAIVPASG